MSEELANLTDRQVAILRLLVTGPVHLTDLDETDAGHLVILQNRNLVNLQREDEGRVGASLSDIGTDFANRSFR